MNFYNFFESTSIRLPRTNCKYHIFKCKMKSYNNEYKYKEDYLEKEKPCNFPIYHKYWFGFFLY